MSARLRTLGVTAGIVTALAISALPVCGQRRPGMRGQDRTELETRVRARFAEMVRERLGLDEAQSDRLGEVVESFQAERMRLGREDQAVRRRIEAMNLERSGDDASALELIRRLEALRLEEARLFQREQERLLEVLTPSQVLAFHAMREEMAERIRRLRGMGPGPGRPPGGGPGGGGMSPYV